jgi:hypothetical protein
MYNSFVRKITVSLYCPEAYPYNNIRIDYHHGFVKRLRVDARQNPSRRCVGEFAEWQAYSHFQSSLRECEESVSFLAVRSYVPLFPDLRRDTTSLA